MFFRTMIYGGVSVTALSSNLVPVVFDPLFSDLLAGDRLTAVKQRVALCSVKILD